MKEIYQKIVELFEKKRFSVLATLIKQVGSSPRGVGTKCLILEDGSVVGTIGGGLLEARVLEEAIRIFSTRSPKKLSLFLKGTDVAETDMLCGGDVEIFLEPVSPEDLDHLSILIFGLDVVEPLGDARDGVRIPIQYHSIAQPILSPLLSLAGRQVDVPDINA